MGTFTLKFKSNILDYEKLVNDLTYHMNKSKEIIDQMNAFDFEYKFLTLDDQKIESRKETEKAIKTLVDTINKFSDQSNQ